MRHLGIATQVSLMKVKVTVAKIENLSAYLLEFALAD